MLAYVIYSKDLGLVFKALGILRDENLRYDVDLDNGTIYINEAEAHRLRTSVLDQILVPRKCFLRTVGMTVEEDGHGKLIYKYGPQGSGVSTGTTGLLRRISNTYNVEVCRGLIYYATRNAFWVTGEGYFSIEKFKAGLAKGQKFPDKVMRFWGLLQSLVTVD